MLGRSKELKSNVLPTKLSVINHYNWIDVKQQNRAFLEMADEILLIWQRARIPTIQKKSVFDRLKVLISKYKIIKRSYNSAKRGKYFNEKLSFFKQNCDNLFDIALCHCKDVCNCSIPEKIKEFLRDQRSCRKLKIICNQKCTIDSENMNTVSDTLEDTSFDSETEEEIIDTYGEVMKKAEEKQFNKKYNIMNLQPIVEEADRYKVSMRATAAISSATLKSIGIIDQDCLNSVIDHNKIRRHMKRNRQQVMDENRLR